MKKGEEWQLQQECVSWYRENFPEWVLFSVPNEACWRNKNYFQSTGLYDGVSDLIAVTPHDVFFIEMKSSKGRQTAEQKAFQQKVESLGWKYFLVRDTETFYKIFSKN